MDFIRYRRGSRVAWLAKYPPALRVDAHSHYGSGMRTQPPLIVTSRSTPW